ncbi:MAG: isocitrate/isopropylmalate family dehydrogenase [Magnetovibrio sp.]|nr:isocitrate/isopropylmalate family dehydrogenase [Magnetovibrio sp.]
MKILILPGDGIGPEITEVTTAALEALDSRFGLGLELVRRDVGLAAIKAVGHPMPDDVMAEIEKTPLTVLGPAGSMEYPPEARTLPSPSMAIRGAFDLYANIRPSRTRPGIPSVAKEMDLVIVRENTEGFYAARLMHEGRGEFMPTPEMAMSLRKITVEGSRRIARAAFELARTRRRKVTVVHKANVFRMTDGLFLSEVRSVAEDYADIEFDDVIVDAMAARLIRHPETFDVVVTTNMFGDILSDEAAELAGGLGLGGSINASDERAVAQAAHGSAPDIAGQDKANPTAHLISTQMLLQWTAIQGGDNQLAAAAQHMEAALDDVLADPANHTPDLGGGTGTRAFGEALARAIAE